MAKKKLKVVHKREELPPNEPTSKKEKAQQLREVLEDMTDVLRLIEENTKPPTDNQ